MSQRRSWDDASPLFRDEALERFRRSAWQPALLSKPVSSTVLALFALAAAGLLLGIATTYEFARKEQVKGYLSPSVGWSQVTASYFGIVSRQLVDPGDAVRPGQVLLEISSGDGLQQALTVQDRILEEIEGQRAALETRANLLARQHERELAILVRQDESDRTEFKRLNEDINLSETRLRIVEQRYRDAHRLLMAGALSQSDVLRLEDELQTRRLAVSERQRAADRLRAAVEVNETRRAQLFIDRDLNQATIRERIHDLAVEESRVRSEGVRRVLAPRTGTVASMRVGIGDAVRPGYAMLDIVPDNAPMEGRLLVPSAAMGFIEPGQDVRVYLDAFPYERYGAQTGRVKSISETTLAPAEMDATSVLTGPAYRVDVAFPDGFNLPPGQQSALRPGMTLSADLVRDYGTLMDWILEPLQGAVRRL